MISSNETDLKLNSLENSDWGNKFGLILDCTHHFQNENINNNKELASGNSGWIIYGLDHHRMDHHQQVQVQAEKYNKLGLDHEINKNSAGGAPSQNRGRKSEFSSSYFIFFKKAKMHLIYFSRRWITLQSLSRSP